MILSNLRSSGGAPQLATTYIVAVHVSTGGTTVEHITEVIWVNETFKSGRTTVAKIIEYIDNGHIAKVSDGKTSAIVEVVRPKGGKPYIRTTADKTKKDNLLSLPPC